MAMQKMKYYYKIKSKKLKTNLDFLARDHPDYIFYAGEPKTRWGNSTIITWTCPRFTHAATLYSYNFILTPTVVKSLKRITEKEAFMRVI
jgi:hypothetical protein